MINKFSAFIIALVIIVTGAYFFRLLLPNAEESSQRVSFLADQEVPEFTYSTIDGQKRKLSDSRGKIVLINFWASWCEPCVQETPALIDLLQKMGDKMEWIAISGDSSVADVEAFTRSFPGMKGPNRHIVWDSDKKLLEKFGIYKLPETFILNPNGLFKKKIAGNLNWASDDAINFFNSLLNSH